MCELATVEIMCAARESRRRRQTELLQRFPGTLVCFSLNIAGPLKRPRFSRAAMDAGEDALFDTLSGARLLHWEERSGPAGHERFYCLADEAETVKRAAAAVEERHPLGRLFDMDVLDRQGNKLSRESMGAAPRRCLLCGETAAVCARSRRHDTAELQRETERMLSAYFCKRASAWLAEQAAGSLRFEVSVTPKPGLVDRAGNGSHRDMNYTHFERSIDALTPYWEELARVGWKHEAAPEEMLELLRPVGSAAEKAMLAATGGINTHKGAVFSLGLLTAAAGWLMAEDRDFSQQELLGLAGRMAKSSLRELSSLSVPHTHGEKAYLSAGIAGARGEAAAGFPHAARARELLQLWRGRGLDENDAGALTLLALITEMEDTNMLARAGKETAETLRRAAAAVLEMEPREAMTRLSELDKQFVAANASPGGCADMLAAGWLLERIFAPQE